MQSVIITDSATSIGKDAFYGCEKLQSFLSPKSSIEIWNSSELKCKAVFGYLQNQELFLDVGIAAGYKKYAIGQRKKLLPMIFQNDAVAALAFYAEEKKITAKNFEEEYLNPVQAAEATECMAFLLDWQNKNISIKDIEKKMEKELTKDPYNAADMKKLWSYEKLEDGTLCLTAYKGSETSVTVPPYIGKTAVSRLGDCVFSLTTATGSNKPQKIRENLKKIEAVFIGDKVTVIGKNAFNNCARLKNITIPDSVSSIGEGEFSGCESLQSITIPAGVTSIGDSAFSGCESLQSVHIGNGVTSIGEEAFYGCESLQSITIPTGVTSIGSYAFSECTSLQSITIPDGVTSIDYESFSGCESLQGATYDNAVYLGNENNPYLVLWKALDKEFSSCKINESTRLIYESAFWDCKSLQSITIPDSVTSIGDEAFHGCESLQSIMIPDGVTSIGDEAFYGCESLQGITIPDSVRSIGDDAFEECGNLTICAHAGSYAEEYAKEYAIKFEAI